MSARKEIRQLMLKHFRKGDSPGKALEDICKKHGEKASTLATVKKWYKQFDEGDFTIEDRREQASQPHSPMQASTSAAGSGARRDNFDIKTLKRLLQKNPYRSFSELGRCMGTSAQTVKRHAERHGLEVKGPLLLWVFPGDPWCPKKGVSKVPVGEIAKHLKCSVDDVLKMYDARAARMSP